MNRSQNARLTNTNRRLRETRNAATARKKAEFIGHMQSGLMIVEACRQMNMHKSTYTRWRQIDPEFKEAADRARELHAGTAEPWDGTFRSFRKEFFGLETYVHHQQIVDALEKVQPREVILILIWPEAGKTSTVEDWICKALGQDANLRITMLSQSSGLSQKSVGKLKARMTDGRQHGRFIARFGPFYTENQERNGKPWAKNYFTVANAENDERDYSVEARAITSKAYGTRIDILVVDDVISAENVAQTDHILHVLRQTYLTRGRRMRTVIIGTRIQPGDVYEKLIEGGVVDKLIEIPALRKDPATGEEIITCPEMWVDRDPDDYASRDELVAAAWEALSTKRRQVGAEVWEASYQQNPQAAGTATFAAYVDDAKDHDRVLATATDGMKIASLDPALGGGTTLLTGSHFADRIDLLDLKIEYGLSSTEQMFEMVELEAITYGFVKLIVETDALQKGIANDQRLYAMGQTYGFEIVPHQTKGKKLDQIMGVASMAGSFMRNEIRIPWGDEDTQRRFTAMIEQLRVWRPTIPTRLLRQDAVMALWFQWRHWMLMRKSLEYDTAMFEMRGLPYPATGVDL